MSGKKIPIEHRVKQQRWRWKKNTTTSRRKEAHNKHGKSVCSAQSFFSLHVSFVYYVYSFCLKHTTYAAKRVLKIPNAHKKTHLSFAVRFKAQHSLCAIEPECLCVILKPIIRIKTRNVFSSLLLFLHHFFLYSFFFLLLLLLCVICCFCQSICCSDFFFLLYAVLPNKHWKYINDCIANHQLDVDYELHVVKN